MSEEDSGAGTTASAAVQTHLPEALLAAAERWIEDHVKPAADGAVVRVEALYDLLPHLEANLKEELEKLLQPPAAA